MIVSANVSSQTNFNLITTSERPVDRFISLMIDAFKTLNTDSLQRKEKSRKIEVLTEENKQQINEIRSQGCWYAEEYYNFLKKIKQEKNIEFLKKKHAFSHGMILNKFFRSVKDSDDSFKVGYKQYKFEMAPGVLPSEAVDSLSSALSFIDCGLACHLAALKAFKTFLTPKKFDDLFLELTPPFYINPHKDLNTPIDTLFNAIAIKDESDIQKGDHCYFGNIALYLEKHSLTGRSNGFHVICSDKNPNRYIGFGLPSEGLTSHEMEKYLFNQYNTQPRSYVNEFLPEKAIKEIREIYPNSESRESDLKDHQILWEEFKKLPTLCEKQGDPIKGNLKLLVFRPSSEIFGEFEYANKKANSKFGEKTAKKAHNLFKKRMEWLEDRKKMMKIEQNRRMQQSQVRFQPSVSENEAHNLINTLLNSMIIEKSKEATLKDFNSIMDQLNISKKDRSCYIKKLEKKFT